MYVQRLAIAQEMTNPQANNFFDQYFRMAAALVHHEILACPSAEQAMVNLTHTITGLIMECSSKAKRDRDGAANGGGDNDG